MDGNDASAATSSATPRPAIPVVAELPIIPSPSLPAVIHSSGPRLSVLQSFRLSKLYRNQFLPLTEASCHIEGPNDHSTAQMASEIQYDDKSLIIEILSPVLDDLKELKALTPESLQDYNQTLNNETHAQVLKQKLLPIGQLIVDCLQTVPLDRRGALERAICHHIADNYWPLPANFFTHLKIQEKYRNALFRLAQRAPAGVIESHPKTDSEQPQTSAIEPDPPQPSLDPRDDSDTPPFPRPTAEQPQASAVEPDPPHPSLEPKDDSDTTAPFPVSAAQQLQPAFVQAAPGSGDFLDLNSYELRAEAIEEADARDLDNV
ncbi:hypothetical protein J4E93_004978 [Alternaria ventricosa]|uniref:uncharacterized protein n=1 Tax=Alternaria ventricosa TaxID=1187951 RepID=UPI0020C3E031|nr:uncharacterized protein J4E93_004978 [Alternaria ventricosa]KAI4646755.1 hypothetical protein J4E93_004978 [Alternaria ventricosa]